MDDNTCGGFALPLKPTGAVNRWFPYVQGAEIGKEGVSLLCPMRPGVVSERRRSGGEGVAHETDPGPIAWETARSAVGQN